MKKTWASGLLGRLVGIGRSPRHPEPARGAVNLGDDSAARARDFSTDSPAAIEKARTEAEKGNPAAQNSFGLRFAFGPGLLRPDDEARKWLGRAAEQGYAEAQFNLGNLCQSASLQRDAPEAGEARIEAYVWFQLAAAQGHTRAAASCEALNLQLTDAELAEGNRRARAFENRLEPSRPAEFPKA